LLPVIGKDIFDIQSLKIIRDPYSNLYENESEWIRTIELLTFSLPKKLGEI
jgi:CO dehydrogenase/acetyl-CoA synthase delta subunit